MVRNIYPNGAMIYRHGFLVIYWMRLLIAGSPSGRLSRANYIAGCDASGGRNDSFTAAMSHRERDGKIWAPQSV
jgi:hypothetical protein